MSSPRQVRKLLAHADDGTLIYDTGSQCGGCSTQMVGDPAKWLRYPSGNPWCGMCDGLMYDD